MRTRSRSACIAAAVAAVSFGAFHADARDLTWDYDPALNDGVAQDGTGVWTLAGNNWVDAAVPGVNTNWNNATPDSAIFGGPTATGTPDPTTPYNVDLGDHVVVQNLTFGDLPNGTHYDINAFGFGTTLTLNGNVTKAGNDGFINFFAPVVLNGVEHVYAMADTGGPHFEFIQNDTVSGTGGITLDNAPFESWGTMVLNVGNSYTGETKVKNGRLVITKATGLGATSAGTTISDIGTLSIGGGESVVGSDLTIAEPITITRSVYAGGEYDHYKSALTFDNTGTSRTHTLSGQLTVDSTDARVQVNSNTVNITSNIVEGPSITPGTGVLTLDGDFGGFVNLTGNNTGIGGPNGGIRLIGGVQLNVSEHNQLGGPSAPLKFEGSATLHPIASDTWMPNFGLHPINQTTFSGGINVDAGNSFTVDIPLGQTATAVGSIGKRGDGTLNLNSVINLRGGQTFWDAGIVNVNNDVTLANLHLRSPVVNIGTGGKVTTVAGFNSFGQDSTGTNGGPDKAVVNITGTGELVQTDNVDFNVSDAANTEGTINLQDNGVLTVNGLMHVAKSAGGKGTINQTGGTFTLNRTGNFTLVLGSRNGTGTYNLSGGTMTSAGEFYVGQGGAGVGVFNMTGGTVNQNNWFVLGREGGQGTVDLSGGIFNKTGAGSSTEIDTQAGIGASSMTIRNAAEYRAQTGDFRVGQGGGAVGSLLMQNSAKLIVSAGEFWVGNGGGIGTATLQNDASISVNNNWIAVGRGGGTGTLDLSGNATVTKAGNGNVEIDFGGGGQGIVNVKDAAIFNIQSGEVWVGQAGGSNGQLNIQDAGAVTTNSWTVVVRGGGTGTLTMSGGSLTKASDAGSRTIIGDGGGSNGTFNQTGGTFTNTVSETWIAAGGNGTWNLSGGTVNTALFDVGHTGGGSATLNVSGPAAMTATTIRIGEADSVSGTLNLDGGSITANQVVGRNSTGTKIFNFNGGTLKAGVTNTTDWMTGAMTVNVKAGGAKLDSNGFDATINTPLVHDAALGATPDGGLTKSGTGSFALAAANTYTGGTTVNAGTLVAAHGDAFAGGALTVNNATAQAQLGLPKAVSVNTVTLTGTGKLDMTDNDLVVKTSTLSAVQAQVTAGFNGGTWDGTGINSSAAATHPNATTALGYGDNAELGLTTFSGVALTGPEILVKYTYYGDADLTGVVDLDDFGLFLTGYQNGSLPRTWIYGDFDYTGVIDLDDFGLFLYGYQNQGGPLSALSEAVADASGVSSSDRAAMQAAISAVPEPASLGVLALAGLGLMGRRRRRDTKSVA